MIVIDNEIIKILPKYRVLITNEKKYKGSMTNEEYDERLLSMNQNIVRIGDVIAQQKPLLHRCLICNELWMSRPVNILNGRGCPSCAKLQRAKARTGDTQHYIEMLHEINDTIIVIDEYIKYDVPINHKCLICGTIWKMSPNNSKKQGCPKCTMEKFKQRMTKPHEEYIKELAIANPILECLEMYSGAKIKIQHRYKDCGHIANITPAAALLGSGCKKCVAIQSGLSKRKTTEQFKKEVYDTNPNIKVIGEYITAIDPIDLLCLVCDYKWSPIADSVIGKNTSGCPKCGLRTISEKLSLTLDIYKQRVFEINPNIEVLGTTYINNMTPIEHKCKICNYAWSVTPNSILVGHGCPNCAGNIKYTIDEVRLIVSEINSNIIVIGPYISANKPLPCRCLVCGYNWNSSLSNIKKGNGCPNCSMSKGEKQIMNILNKLGIPYDWQKTYNGLVGVGNGLLSYDFYLSTYNSLIEYQGNFHDGTVNNGFQTEEQFKIQQEHDKRKREYAKDHNINLLEIWYYDYDNIEQILTEYLNLETVETVIPA